MENLKKRTSNTVENYYRQTEPEQIKTRYKTKNGILTYLELKMKKWTKKTRKKNQHPITLQPREKKFFIYNNFSVCDIK